MWCEEMCCVTDDSTGSRCVAATDSVANKLGPRRNHLN